MIKIASLPTIAAALLACGLAAAPAQAGPSRTWVSGMGTDSGACTRTAPCKTFAFGSRIRWSRGMVLLERPRLVGGAIQRYGDNATPNLVFAGFKSFFGH
jgi:hypothetical protein